MGNEINKVLTGLYIGNLNSASDSTELSSHGITHVLAIYEDAKPLIQGVKYMCLPVSDSLTTDISTYFPLCNDFIHAARTSGGSVLVHCKAGVSRSVTIVVAYLMTVANVGWRDALKAVKAVRPFAAPNFNFTQQLRIYKTFGISKERARLLGNTSGVSKTLNDEQEVKDLIQSYLINHRSIESDSDNEDLANVVSFIGSHRTCSGPCSICQPSTVGETSTNNSNTAETANQLSSAHLQAAKKKSSEMQRAIADNLQRIENLGQNSSNGSSEPALLEQKQNSVTDARSNNSKLTDGLKSNETAPSSVSHSNKAVLGSSTDDQQVNRTEPGKLMSESTNSSDSESKLYYAMMGRLTGDSDNPSPREVQARTEALDALFANNSDRLANTGKKAEIDNSKNDVTGITNSQTIDHNGNVMNSLNGNIKEIKAEDGGKANVTDSSSNDKKSVASLAPQNRASVSSSVTSATGQVNVKTSGKIPESQDRINSQYNETAKYMQTFSEKGKNGGTDNFRNFERKILEKITSVDETSGHSSSVASLAGQSSAESLRSTVITSSDSQSSRSGSKSQSYESFSSGGTEKYDVYRLKRDSEMISNITSVSSGKDTRNTNIVSRGSHTDSRGSQSVTSASGAPLPDSRRDESVKRSKPRNDVQRRESSKNRIPASSASSSSTIDRGNSAERTKKDNTRRNSRDSQQKEKDKSEMLQVYGEAMKRHSREIQKLTDQTKENHTRNASREAKDVVKKQHGDRNSHSSSRNNSTRSLRNSHRSMSTGSTSSVETVNFVNKSRQRTKKSSEPKTKPSKEHLGNRSSSSSLSASPSRSSSGDSSSTLTGSSSETSVLANRKKNEDETKQINNVQAVKQSDPQRNKPADSSVNFNENQFKDSEKNSVDKVTVVSFNKASDTERQGLNDDWLNSIANRVTVNNTMVESKPEIKSRFDFEATSGSEQEIAGTSYVSSKAPQQKFTSQLYNIPAPNYSTSMYNTALQGPVSPINFSSNIFNPAGQRLGSPTNYSANIYNSSVLSPGLPNNFSTNMYNPAVERQDSPTNYSLNTHNSLVQSRISQLQGLTTSTLQTSRNPFQKSSSLDQQYYNRLGRSSMNSLGVVGSRPMSAGGMSRLTQDRRGREEMGVMGPMGMGGMNEMMMFSSGRGPETSEDVVRRIGRKYLDLHTRPWNDFTRYGGDDDFMT